MRRPLGLLIYLLFTAKGKPPALPEPGAIRDPVVWLVAHDIAEARSFINIARKLEATGPEIHLLITGPDELGENLDLPKTMSFRPMPGEKRQEIRAFLKAWSPAICFWAGGAFKPGILHETKAADIPLILVNCEQGTLTEGDTALQRRLVRRTARLFEKVFVTTEECREICVKAGLAEDTVTVSGPLSEGILADPCDTETLDVLATKLTGRDMWLGARVPPEEVGTVLKVHEELRGTNRRLLFILNPKDIEESATLAIGLAKNGWKIGLRSKGDPIAENTQIYIADRPHELGLWYRLSPIAYMGGTLSGSGCDPRQAAALGSAIVHGPRTGSFRSLFDDLHSQVPSAARQAVTPEALAKAISELLSPDQAALQAHSAWEYASRGAELTDQLSGVITEAVERNG